MDIALIVDKLVPGAEYTQAQDYPTLERTWTDARPIPTEAEISAAEAGVLADQAARDALPPLGEVVEALLARDADPSLDGIKARIAAAKVAGRAL